MPLSFCVQSYPKSFWVLFQKCKLALFIIIFFFVQNVLSVQEFARPQPFTQKCTFQWQKPKYTLFFHRPHLLYSFEHQKNDSMVVKFCVSPKWLELSLDQNQGWCLVQFYVLPFSNRFLKTIATRDFNFQSNTSRIWQMTPIFNELFFRELLTKIAMQLISASLAAKNCFPKLT